jgi:hypothetical protein
MRVRTIQQLLFFSQMDQSKEICSTLSCPERWDVECTDTWCPGHKKYGNETDDDERVL